MGGEYTMPRLMELAAGRGPGALGGARALAFPAEPEIRVGDKVRIIPAHSCTTPICTIGLCDPARHHRRRLADRGAGTLPVARLSTITTVQLSGGTGGNATGPGAIVPIHYIIAKHHYLTRVTVVG